MIPIQPMEYASLEARKLTFDCLTILYENYGTQLIDSLERSLQSLDFLERKIISKFLQHRRILPIILK